MLDHLSAVEPTRLTEWRLRQYALDLPGADEVLGIKRRLVVAVSLDTDGRPPQRAEARNQVEFLLRETFALHGRLACLQLHDWFGLDLSRRLRGGRHPDDQLECRK